MARALILAEYLFEDFKEAAALLLILVIILVVSVAGRILLMLRVSLGIGRNRWLGRGRRLVRFADSFWRRRRLRLLRHGRGIDSRRYGLCRVLVGLRGGLRVERRRRFILVRGLGSVF